MAATPCISSSSSLNGQRVEKAGPYERPLVQGFFFCSSLALASQDLLLWARLICLLGLAYSASPYLFKASKYRRFPSLCCHLHPNDVRRPFRDKLVWTSLIYAVPAVYAIAAHQYGIAVLQTLTTIGSTLFHWTRETMFFNLDNVFAMSLLFTVIWGLICAVKVGAWLYIASVVGGGGIAIYFIVICGLPAEIVSRPGSASQVHRRTNPEYEIFHMLWHVMSGLVTILSIHFFEVKFPHLEAGASNFQVFPDVPIVPSVALAASTVLNLYGNRLGIMPLV